MEEEEQKLGTRLPLIDAAVPRPPIGQWPRALSASSDVNAIAKQSRPVLVPLKIKPAKIKSKQEPTSAVQLSFWLVSFFFWTSQWPQPIPIQLGKQENNLFFFCYNFLFHHDKKKKAFIQVVADRIVWRGAFFFSSLRSYWLCLPRTNQTPWMKSPAKSPPAAHDLKKKQNVHLWALF